MVVSKVWKALTTGDGHLMSTFLQQSRITRLLLSGLAVLLLLSFLLLLLLLVKLLGLPLWFPLLGPTFFLLLLLLFRLRNGVPRSPISRLSGDADGMRPLQQDAERRRGD